MKLTKAYFAILFNLLAFSALSTPVIYHFSGVANFTSTGNSGVDPYIARYWFGAESLDPENPTYGTRTAFTMALEIDDTAAPYSQTIRDEEYALTFSRYNFDSLSMNIGTTNWTFLSPHFNQLDILNGISDSASFNTTDRIRFGAWEDIFLGLGQSLYIQSASVTGIADDDALPQSDIGALDWFNNLHSPTNERNNPTGSISYYWESDNSPGFTYIGNINLNSVTLDSVERTEIHAPSALAFLLLGSVVLGFYREKRMH